jgi:transcription initiation factor TFIID subunit 13
MYGFGDDPNPSADSIALMDDLVIDYITEMVRHKGGQQRDD